jgi:hypothetical protein
MSFHARLVAVQDTALNIVRVWWRPMICAEFAITGRRQHDLSAAEDGALD